MRALMIGVVLLTLVIFYFYRSPPILYLGLSFVFLILIGEKERTCNLKINTRRTIFALILLVLAVLSLMHPFWKTPSPLTFLSLSIGALLLILCKRLQEFKVEILYIGIGPLLAALSRTNTFQRIETIMSSWFVKATGALLTLMFKLSDMPAQMSGNTITTRGMIVIVKPGCSGLGAFFLYLLATALLVYARKSKFKEASLLLVGALGIIPINAIRIFILILVGYHYGVSYLELFHSHLGDIIFLAYVYFYWRTVLSYSSGLKQPASK